MFDVSICVSCSAVAYSFHRSGRIYELLLPEMLGEEFAQYFRIDGHVSIFSGIENLTCVSVVFGAI